MGRRTFENYGLRSSTLDSATEASGRYSSQQESERLVARDVAEKLDLRPSDELLEIGCGPGQILIPLSFFVSRAVGVDHPQVIATVRERFRGENVELRSGNFIDLEMNGLFDKILIYSVVQCLESCEEALAFILKAAALLRPGGRMLVGDLPNINLKKRFLSTNFGDKFARDFMQKSAPARVDGTSQDAELVHVDDDLVLRILELGRRQGFETHLLAQSDSLPFGHTREDIVFRAHRK